MTSDDFNKKWQDHLENGHYGLAIDDDGVIEYLDKKFEEFKVEYPDFEYSQIKMKFGYSRFYSTLPYEINMEIEKEIDKLIRNDN